MSATEILTIGSVIKHRGEYNAKTVYYTNNQVTICNCVFQALGNNFNGVPPIEENDDGTIKLANTSTWKCIVDNVKLYNAALSTNSLSDRIDSLSASLSEGNIRFVSFADLDTVLGETYQEIYKAIQAVNGKHTLKYIVTNNESGADIFVGYLDMFADGLLHCLTQEFTTNYLIDADGKIDGSSHNHKLHKYVRYYCLNWSGTDWRGEEWARGTWTKWNSPLEDVEASVKTKVGYLAIINTTADTTTIGAFADESGYTKWQKNPTKYASLLLTSVEIATSGGGGSTTTNCGFYVSEDALKAAYPSPTLGMMAFVGSGTTYTIYRCAIAGKWTKTTETFTLEFPLDDYTTLDTYNKGVATLQSNIDAEATARQTADAKINDTISKVEAGYKAADESMQTDIDELSDVISAIKTGDLPLVTPSIKPSASNTYLWQIYNADGTLVTTSADKTLNVAYGYKVNFNGCMYWESADGYKNPTAMNGGDWSSKALPKSGVLSDAISYTSIVADKTIYANVKAHKQGLVYKDGIIKWADSTDFDTKSASVKVHFQYKVVAATSESAIDEATLKTLLGGSSATLQDGRSKTLTGVTTSSTQYFVYAYPSKLGKLSKIVMNDATPLLDGGFELSTISVVEPTTKATIEYYVYTSVQKGAFTNVKLTIA